MADKTNWGLVLLVCAGIWVFMGMPGLPDSSDGVIPDDGDTTICGVEDVAFTPKMVRLGKSGTSLSTASYNYFITTDKLGSQSGATATTVPTYYSMEVMFGENSTDYYTDVQNVNIKCSDPTYKDVSLAYADTSVTSYFENTNGQVNAGAVQEAMGASDEATFSGFLKAAKDKYFGNPTSTCKNLAVIEYDKTYILKAEGEDPEAVPGSFAFYNTSYDGSAAFVIPKSASGERVEYSFTLTATTTQPDGTNDPRLTVFDCDIDKDEDDLSLIHGVADEDNNLLSLANKSVYIYLS